MGLRMGLREGLAVGVPLESWRASSSLPGLCERAVLPPRGIARAGAEGTLRRCGAARAAAGGRRCECQRARGLLRHTEGPKEFEDVGDGGALADTLALVVGEAFRCGVQGRRRVLGPRD